MTAPHLPRRATRLAATACLAATLAGCATLPTATSSPAGPLASGAPRVTDPRDLSGIPACQLLTHDELRRFRVDPATAERLDVQQTEICDYHSADLLDQASVTRAYQWTPGGMDRLYRNRQLIEIFEPGTLDGYPTVVTDTNRANKCDLNVGVADNQLLIVTVSKLTGSTAPHACDQARAIASAVLAHLPPLR